MKSSSVCITWVDTNSHPDIRAEAIISYVIKTTLEPHVTGCHQSRWNVMKAAARCHFALYIFFFFIISPQILIFFPLLNLRKTDKLASASSCCFLSIAFHSGCCLSPTWQQPNVEPEQQQLRLLLTFKWKPGLTKLWHNYLCFSEWILTRAAH